MNEQVKNGHSPEVLKTKVLEIIRRMLQELGNEIALRQLSHQAKFSKDLGFDSLAKVELFTRIEQQFSMRFGEQAMMEIETPAELIRRILEGSGSVVETHEIVAHTIQETQPPDEANTLNKVLLYQYKQRPTQTHIILRSEKEEPELLISFERLFKKSLLVAHGLRQRGLQPQETVAIMLPTGEDFFYAFLGTLLAGGVAVPLYPPFRADLLEEYAHRQVGILQNASARFLITFAQAKAVALLLKPKVPSLIEITNVQHLSDHSIENEEFPQVHGDDPALIQYTSGSTGNPKGVLLLHKNLLSNIRAIIQTIQVKPTDVCVSWLPLYHDMGLIGSWLCSMYCGNPIYIMSPLAFLSRPERWLWAIHQHRGTISPAPNFAYELCVRKIKESDLAGIDLQSWRVAFNGAEPVSRLTLDRFFEKFGKFGFSPKTMYPVYGLAESCVAVCFPPVNRGPFYDRVKRPLFEEKGIAEVAVDGEDFIEFVATGGPLPNHEVRLIDLQGNTLPDRIQGHLQFRGPSVMKEYYRNPDATQKTISHEGWCDSGDLAYRVDKDYFITGREKDLIIKGGRNLYPQEIEELVADIEGVRRGCVVAFGNQDEQSGTEQILVAAEIKPSSSKEEITHKIQETLTQHLGLPADKVILLEPGAIPKTSSGKVRRAACKAMYLKKVLTASRHSTFRQVLQIIFHTAPSFLLGQLRKIGRFFWIVWYMFVILTVFMPLWIVLHWVRSAPLALRLSRWTSKVFLTLLGIRCEVHHPEHFRNHVPAILVSNHTSYLDVVIYTAILNIPYRFLGKKEAFDYWFTRPMMKGNQHIGVDRRDMQQSLKDKQKITEHLTQQTSVAIFPEGTFTRSVGLRPFRLGAFSIAVETQKPIIPMAIKGARKVLPPGDKVLIPGKIEIFFGDPIFPQGNDWKEVIRLRDQTQNFILKHCGEPRLNLVYSDIPGESNQSIENFEEKNINGLEEGRKEVPT
ncbi:MAG: AMP-binding protein [Planctomycetota bacterium]